MIKMAGELSPLIRFSVPSFLFFREYRLRFFRFFKYGLIMVFVSTYFSVLVSLPSISEFAEIGPYKVARFDVFLSGPIDKSEIEKVKSKVETIVEGARSGGVEVYVKNDFAGRTDLILVDNLQKALEISEINEKYIRKGKVSKKGAVIDEYSAKKLGVDLGDQISIKIRDVAAEYKIVAILYATSVTRGIILADYPQKIKETFRPFEYTSYWIKLKNGVKGELSGVKGELSYAAIKRVELIKQQQEELDEFMHNWMLRLLKYGSIVVLLFIALRDILSLLDSRKKDYALLLGLGASRRSLAANFSTENALRMTIVVYVGILCAKKYIQTVMGFYYPPQAFIVSMIYLLLASIMASILGGTVAFEQLKRIPIAQILAEG